MTTCLVQLHLCQHSLGLLCLLLQLEPLLDLACLLGVLPALAGAVDMTASRNHSRTWNLWIPPLPIVAAVLGSLPGITVEVENTILRPIGIAEEATAIVIVAVVTIVVITTEAAIAAAATVVVIIEKETTETIAVLIGTMSLPLWTATIIAMMTTRLLMKVSLAQTIVVAVAELWSWGTAGSGPR